MSNRIVSAYNALHEKAESELAKKGEAGKIRIQVGSATCENASGAPQVYEQFRKLAEASGREDIVLRKTGCTGRCSREPIVGVLFPGRMPVQYQDMDPEKAHAVFVQHVLKGNPVQELVLDAAADPRYEFFLCRAERCARRFEQDMEQLFRRKLRDADIPREQADIIAANCFGLCRHEEEGRYMHVMVRPTKVMYRVSSEQDLDEIIELQVRQGKTVNRLLVEEEPIGRRFFQIYGDSSFFNRQSRIALRNSGIMDPENIYEYIHYNGFRALSQVLERGDPQWVIDEITSSKLRGRGGAGFPTGVKWANAARAGARRNPQNNGGTPGDTRDKYIICNADEGDPGAFMDRSTLESDPYSVIEGLIIGAFAIGARQGFFYVRAEYPLAIQRIENALDQCRRENVLGENILDSGFDFDLQVRLGAGAFVCGEETSLIHSIEGGRGQPRIRPPYPTTSGLWGMPTVINNVETLANIAPIILYGSAWFAQVGTERSGGTKVFALAGKVEHTGLVEVPMGTTLREVIFDIGGGVPGGRKLKAVQTGGPAGGCLPAEWIDTPVDFETLSEAGSIMGSGGMIVMDEDDCMVDIAKFFIAFSQDESCGKCTPCREGNTRMLEILNRIISGEGTLDDLDKLERLAMLIQKSSLCGLGRAAPNPVLSTLRHFRGEYESHVVDKICPTGRCPNLVPREVPAQPTTRKPAGPDTGKTGAA